MTTHIFKWVGCMLLGHNYPIPCEEKIGFYARHGRPCLRCGRWI